MSASHNKATPEHEHEFEAAHGLPETLPPGEHLQWQGAPEWRRLAIEVMHIRTIAVYFAIMLLWRSGTVLYDGGTALESLASIAWLVPLSLVALGTLALLAWLTSRTTVYTITNRRVVMRIGIVLSVTFNLPYRAMASAGLRAHADGTGDIAIVLAGDEDRIAYAHLWPHARPWRVKRPEPMLRAVPQALKVGQTLTAAIAASSTEGRLLTGPRGSLAGSGAATAPTGRTAGLAA